MAGDQTTVRIAGPGRNTWKKKTPGMITTVMIAIIRKQPE
jgi:hypothetical protein